MAAPWKQACGAAELRGYRRGVLKGGFAGQVFRERSELRATWVRPAAQGASPAARTRWERQRGPSGSPCERHRPHVVSGGQDAFFWVRLALPKGHWRENTSILPGVLVTSQCLELLKIANCPRPCGTDRSRPLAAVRPLSSGDAFVGEDCSPKSRRNQSTSSGRHSVTAVA